MQTHFSFGLDRALDARAAPGHIKAGHLRGFNTIVRNRGADPARILERHEIDAAALADPNYLVDCAAAAKMLDYCSVLFNDALFGLRFAEQQDPDVFGCVTVLARSAPTFRKAVQVIIDYLPLLHSPEGEVDLVTTSGLAEVRCRSSVDLCAFQQTNIHGFLLVVKALQMLGGEYFEPRYINFACELSPPMIKYLQQRFGCKIQTGERHAVALPLDLLDRPVATSNRLLYELLGSYLALVSRTPHAQNQDQIGTYIRGALPSGTCSIEGCAMMLGISARALQKRLARRGTNFSAVLQAQRIHIARQALLETNDSLDEIAYSLGYSDQTCFGRAFKQWTGLTPNAYRARRQSRSESSASLPATL